MRLSLAALLLLVVLSCLSFSFSLSPHNDHQQQHHVTGLPAPSSPTNHQQPQQPMLHNVNNNNNNNNNNRAARADNCIQQPTQPSCANYTIPDSQVNEDIGTLCDHPMHGATVMPGCTVRHLCQRSDRSYLAAEYCQPFSVLKDLCTDMPGMNGCQDYVSMCQSGSVVKECQQDMLPGLPPSRASMVLSGLIYDICNDMPMEGCDSCKNTTGSLLPCDLLTSYSKLCFAMPGMSQCQSWKQMCDANPDSTLCSTKHGGSDLPPQMRMYFHTGIVDYVLFEDWVPRTNWQYALTWLAVFVFALFYELFKTVRMYLDRVWARRRYQVDASSKVTHHHHHNDDGESAHLQLTEQPDEPQTFKECLTTPFHFASDFARAGLHFVEVGWALLLMLVAMTFNVGLFMAVCCGAFTGMLLFGRYLYAISATNQTSQMAYCH
ncbi:Copper transport protein [Balamuthia mandrillaris]